MATDLLPKRAKLFEFFVALAVIGVCAYFLQSALLRMQEDAERLVVETTISNVNTAVRLAQAQLIVQGREGEIPGLFSGSPARWLEDPLPAYVEVDTIGPAILRSGGWVWERRSGVLHYLPRLGSGLVVEGGGGLQWAWVRGGVSSLRSGLQPVRQYRWRVK